MMWILLSPFFVSIFLSVSKTHKSKIKNKPEGLLGDGRVRLDKQVGVRVGVGKVRG